MPSARSSRSSSRWRHESTLARSKKWGACLARDQRDALGQEYLNAVAMNLKECRIYERTWMKHVTDRRRSSATPQPRSTARRRSREKMAAWAARRNEPGERDSGKRCQTLNSGRRFASGCCNAIRAWYPLARFTQVERGAIPSSYPRSSRGDDRRSLRFRRVTDQVAVLQAVRRVLGFLVLEDVDPQVCRCRSRTTSLSG